MSGLTKRRFPINDLDWKIFRDRYKEDMMSCVGFSTLPYDEALRIMEEVQEEVKQGAAKYQTYDDYWVDQV